MGAILLIVAVILFSIISPFYMLGGFILSGSLKKLFDYFHSIAFAIDQLGNVMGGPLMNKALLKKNPAKLYGNPDETISHVTGVNYRAQTLTSFGYFVAHCLDAVDPNHVNKAADNDQRN